MIKKAENSNEIVIRIVELEGKDKTVNIESFKKIERAKLTNLIEEEIEDLIPVSNNCSICKMTRMR